jgi:hypothetical protein
MKISVVPVVVLCALCLLVGGALAGAKITGKQIKNGSITGKDVKNGSLTARDIAPATLAGQRGPAGPPGPTGSQGDPGTDGADGTDGTDGVSGYQTLSATTSVINNGYLQVSRSCSGGRTLISAFGWLTHNVHPVMVLWDSSTTAVAYAKDPPADTLNLRIVCATTS